MNDNIHILKRDWETRTAHLRKYGVTWHDPIKLSEEQEYRVALREITQRAARLQ